MMRLRHGSIGRAGCETKRLARGASTLALLLAVVACSSTGNPEPNSRHGERLAGDAVNRPWTPRPPATPSPTRAQCPARARWRRQR